MKALLIIFGLVAICTSAEEIRCVGIAGNSGEQGVDLVRFGQPVVYGMGVVHDKFGSIWDRGGSGMLNRYAIDGRLLAQYPLTIDSDSKNDTIVLSGHRLLIKSGKNLFRLAVDAPAGTAPDKINVSASRLSPSAADGWAAALDGKRVFKVNANGETREVGILDGDAQTLEIGPDGTVYVQAGQRLIRLFRPDGTISEKSAEVPGDRPQLLDGFWFGHHWHGTIRRYDPNWMPAPGVVLGGNSGSFIGHVAENPDLFLGRGMARISPDLYAVSGVQGIVNLLEWQASEKKMKIVRRIGAVSWCNGIGLDREGRIWHNGGQWEWRDGPDAPVHNGIPLPDRIFASCMTPNNGMIAYGRMWDKPALFYGSLSSELKCFRIETPTALSSTAAAVTLSEVQGRPALLVMQSDGQCTAVHVDGNGGYQGEAGPVEFKTSAPLTQWTSLVSIGPQNLTAAADGWVVEFRRNGNGWLETRRWNQWKPGEKFGSEIHLSTDSGRLWVSDTEQHRVVCFDMKQPDAPSVFGISNQSGNDLTHMNRPTAITANGNRAVAFDSVNQRLMKLALENHPK